MHSLRFAHVDTPLGPMLVAESDLGIAAVSRSRLSDFLAELGRRFGGSDLLPGDLEVTWLTDALTGGPLPEVDLRGLSAFDTRVYEIVRAVPAGETVTYGEVAAAIGSPGGARAVGGAMSRCPLFPAVPCHRVVRAADGWSGWGGDVALKRRLLLSERSSPVPRG